MHLDISFVNLHNKNNLYLENTSQHMWWHTAGPSQSVDYEFPMQLIPRSQATTSGMLSTLRLT